MSAALRTLEPIWPALLDADPEFGWVAARAWRTLGAGPAPEPVQPWLALEALAAGPVDPTGLASAIAAAAPGHGARVLTEAGRWLDPTWALALDDLRPEPWSDAAFADLARVAPERAARRIQQASMASRRGPGLLYEALVAWLDAGIGAPESVRRLQAELEQADRFLIEEDLRYQGRLRLAARSDGATTLAAEAIDEVGAEEVFFGLWAVAARAARPAEVFATLHSDRTPTREVLAAVQALVVPGAALPLADLARSLQRRVDGDELHRRQVWPAAWRLLSAAVSAGDGESVEILLRVGLPPWAIELATWRPLRRSPACLVQVLEWLGKTPGGALAGVVQAPPWGDLPGPVVAARLAVRADPTVPLPSSYAWRDGAP